MSSPADIDMRDLWNLAFRFAKSRGYGDIAEDFAQEACITRIEKGHFYIEWRFVDYLRELYGRSSRVDHKELKINSTHYRINALKNKRSIHEPTIKRFVKSPTPPEDWRDLVNTKKLTEKEIYVLEAVMEDETLETIAHELGLTKSRICQIIKDNIRPKLQKFRKDIYR